MLERQGARRQVYYSNSSNMPPFIRRFEIDADDAYILPTFRLREFMEILGTHRKDTKGGDKGAKQGLEGSGETEEDLSGGWETEDEDDLGGRSTRTEEEDDVGKGDISEEAGIVRLEEEDSGAALDMRVEC